MIFLPSNYEAKVGVHDLAGRLVNEWLVKTWKVRRRK